MDITTILGFIIGLGGILGGATLEGLPLGTIFQSTAAIIVFGGTIGATMVTTPLLGGKPLWWNPLDTKCERLSFLARCFNLSGTVMFTRNTLVNWFPM